MSDTLSAKPRHSKTFWLDHVQRWQESSLSKVAYSEQHNLNRGSFYHWSRPATLQALAQSDNKLLPIKLTAEPTPIAFLPLSVEPSLHDAGCASVQRGGTTVSLPTCLEPAQLQLWLAAIHQLHV